jgi:hypothetical protein
LRIQRHLKRRNDTLIVIVLDARLGSNIRMKSRMQCTEKKRHHNIWIYNEARFVLYWIWFLLILILYLNHNWAKPGFARTFHITMLKVYLFYWTIKNTFAKHNLKGVLKFSEVKIWTHHLDRPHRRDRHLSNDLSQTWQTFLIGI